LGLTNPKVTVFRFGERAVPPSAFGHLSVIQQAQLTPAATQRLLAFLSDPSTYGPSDCESEPGCIAHSLGLRFEENSEVYDLFLCLPCHWLFPANAAAQRARLNLMLLDSSLENLSGQLASAFGTHSIPNGCG
jgi:hypothetical protein